MGRGLLLGILDGLFDILALAFGKLIDWIVVPVLENLLPPIIRMLTALISHFVGFFCYNVGKFILALIDFVQGLFRVLCGLESNEMSIALGDNGSGDILVQVIRSSEIQQAFLAMCIVGLFLLLITSVFQIIKTEYTTEGAKNSKTPIMQKAFKSLANLLLLPLLVVFGIIIANNILGLIDKATSPDDGVNPTVSGLIFVTAASDAHYRVGGVEKPLQSDNLLDNVGHIIELSLKEGFKAFGDDSAPPSSELKNAAIISNIEDGFISQAANYKYYDSVQVSTYYDYSQINYLILILGGIIILKCFFFTCFGLIIRLYKCAVLFIISPVVIGLTPMNEGGLGKWRTSFMGQVLSAYGTVLSVNIFLIVVRVLINIQLNLKTTENFYFNSNFLTYLLKSIIVIAGCLMIEGFSKELGGYFGAEDAMSAGGDMAKKVGSTAMKAVAGATAIGMGGAALVGGALKAPGGIADKLTGGALKDGKEAFKKSRAEGKGFWSSVGAGGKAAGKTAVDKGVVGTGRKIVGKLGNINALAADSKIKETARGRAIQLQNHQDAVSRYNEADKFIQDYDEKDKKANDIKAKLSQTGKNKPTNQERKQLTKELTGLQSELTKNKAKYQQAEKDRDAAKKQQLSDADAATLEKYVKRDSAFKEMTTNARDTVSRGYMNIQSGLVGMADESIQSIPGAGLFKTWKKHQDSGSKLLGDDHTAALESSRKYWTGKKEDALNASLLGTNWAMNTSRRAAEMKTAKQFVEDVNVEKVNIEAGALSTLNNAIANSAQFNKMSDSDKANYAVSIADRLTGMGASITANEVAALVSAGQKQDTYDFKINLDPKAIEKAINEAIAKGGSNAEIISSLTKLMQNTQNNTLMVKKIEELIKKLQGELGGK